MHFWQSSVGVGRAGAMAACQRGAATYCDQLIGAAGGGRAAAGGGTHTRAPLS